MTYPNYSKNLLDKTSVASAPAVVMVTGVKDVGLFFAYNMTALVPKGLSDTLPVVADIKLASNYLQYLPGRNAVERNDLIKTLSSLYVGWPPSIEVILMKNLNLFELIKEAPQKIHNFFSDSKLEIEELEDGGIVGDNSFVVKIAVDNGVDADTLFSTIDRFRDSWGLAATKHSGWRIYFDIKA